MKIKIPTFSLIILIGAAGAGKSTFARKHFLLTEIVSSDVCRGLVSDNEADQSATKDAFELLHYIAVKRLQRGKLTVIDATSTVAEDRQHLIQLAQSHQCSLVAIVLNLSVQICQEQNRNRRDRQVEASVIDRQFQNVQRSLETLQSEGFWRIYCLDSVEQIKAVEIERQPL